MAVYELATAVKQRMLENDAVQLATSAPPATTPPAALPPATSPPAALP
jgi:hypothetical protein